MGMRQEGGEPHEVIPNHSPKKIGTLKASCEMSRRNIGWPFRNCWNCWSFNIFPWRSRDEDVMFSLAAADLK
jgi:hypothetical protein